MPAPSVTGNPANRYRPFSSVTTVAITGSPASQVPSPSLSWINDTLTPAIPYSPIPGSYVPSASASNHTVSPMLPVGVVVGR